MREIMSKPKPPASAEPNVRERGFGSRRFWRRFRLWEKKRGDHQTGSSRWGAAGETLFFAGLFVFGIVLIAQLVSLRVIWKTESIFTSNLGLVLAILLLVPLIGVSAYLAIYHALTAGNSAERLAAIAKRAKDSELLAEVQPNQQTPLPTIPNVDKWKDSPGIRLAYRLPTETSTTWRLAIAAAFCLVWNGAVAVLCVLALNQEDGFRLSSLITPSWWTVFRIVVLIYIAIGVLSARHLFRMLLRATVVGPTSVEVSDLPLLPGGGYRVFLSQSGHVRIDSLEVTLVCDEEVSFADGTDTRAESRRVFEADLFRHEVFEILPSEPFHCDCPLEIPTEAMHSFVTNSNAVTWKVVVRLQPSPLLGSFTEPKQEKPNNEMESETREKRAAKRGFWSKLKRSVVARIKRRNKSKWPTIQRVFPLVVHPKP